MVSWLKDGGALEDVVVSTRVRLARNLKSIPFPHKIRGTEKEKQVKDVAKLAIENCGFTYFELHDLDPITRDQLVECHIISPALRSWPDAALIMSPDGSISVMIMEEDHYRIQVLQAGLDVEHAMDTARECHNLFTQKAEFAYHKRFGYLTACPTNVGTGLRISAMMHLPALKLAGKVQNVAASIGQLGMTVRGIFGEGTKALGDIYQISNQLTLGVSQKDIMQKCKEVVAQIVSIEREMRKELYQNQKLDLEDMILRTYGVLQYAKKLSVEEALDGISKVNLGVALGMIRGVPPAKGYRLMMEVMPSMLKKDKNKEIEVLRADTIRQAMK